MTKFCTKCGKELKDGKKCDCGKNNKKENSKFDIKESAMECLEVLKKVFITPLEAIKDFVCESKLFSGIIIIILTALSTGLYKIATLKNIYSATSTNLSDIFNMSLYSKAASPEYLKEFFTTFASNLAEYAIIILIGYVILSKILKVKANWKEIVNAVAICLSVVFVANIINSILVFVDVEFISNIMVAIFSFASAFSILLLYYAVKQISKADENKLFVSVVSMFVLATLLMDIIEKILN